LNIYSSLSKQHDCLGVANVILGCKTTESEDKQILMDSKGLRTVWHLGKN